MRQITIEERTPAFLLAPNLDSEPNSALSSDGVLIDHDYLPFNSNIKAKKLLTYGVRNGHDEVWNKKRVEEILKLTKAMEAYSGLSVVYIDIRNQKDVYIMLDDYLIRFGEINDSAISRAKRIASILPAAKKNADKLKYIDLRWEDSCYLRLEGAKEQRSENKMQQNQPSQIQAALSEQTIKQEDNEQPKTDNNQE